MAFTAPIFVKLTFAEQNNMEIFYTEFIERDKNFVKCEN